MLAVAADPATPLSWVRPRGRADVHVVVTDRRDGDLAVATDRSVLEPRRRAVADAPWSWLRQVHGADVRRVGDHPIEGDEGDALVTASPGRVLAVHTADCAPVALVSEGPVAVVHAGWRGVAAGVLPASVEALRRAGARSIAAWLGPCIHPSCYEFGADDLDHVASLLGDEVRATTATGAPALDLPAAVRASLAAAGIDELAGGEWCTACDERWYSHRARRDRGRQAIVAWIDEP